MSNKGKILGFGALGLALLASSKKASSKTVVQDVAPVAFSPNDTQLEEILNLIKNNGAIRTLLKGEKGDSVKGDKGDTGLAGNQIINFGGSLAKNSAFELNSTEFTTGFQLTGESWNGLNVATTTNANPKFSQIYIDKRYIYKVSLSVKMPQPDNYISVSLDTYDKNMAEALNLNSYVFLYSTPITETLATFKDFVYYFSGFGNSVINAIPRIFTSKQIYVSAFVIEKVGLGESVPHNLPHLPLNQTVINNTTGKVGIYNGTTVDYYF